jgi:peptide/nickel transport system substrate-binding protein
VPSAATPARAFASDATLTFGLAGEPVNWNPAAATARATTDPALATVVDAVLPSASVAGADDTLRSNPALVSSVVETAADPRTATPQTVTYEIDPRSMWSDGVAITGADFVYTWEAQSGRTGFLDKDGQAFTPASTAGYRQISSVTSPTGEADRVVVRFATPDADWESLFDPILPAHVARAVGFDRGFTDPVTSLVSGGPFLVQSYQPGADIVLVRNPRWWGPAANLSTLDIVFVDSAAEAAVSLEQGQLDAAVTAFTPATVAALRAIAGLTVSVTDADDFDDLVFDERPGPLAVRAVRLAIMVAVDRQSLARVAASSGDTPAAPVQDRAFPPGTAGYRDHAGVLGQTGGAEPRAVALLSAAGYVRRGSTLVHLGRAVGVTMAVDTASPLATIEVAGVVAACRRLGIAVHLTASSKRRTVPSGGMALVEAPLTADPAALAGTYTTGSAPNPSGYSSPVMDRLLSRLATAGSTAERNEIIDGVDALAWSDAVDLPLLGVPRVLAFQSRYAPLSTSGAGADPARWGIPAT